MQCVAAKTTASASTTVIGSAPAHGCLRHRRRPAETDAVCRSGRSVAFATTSRATSKPVPSPTSSQRPPGTTCASMTRRAATVRRRSSPSSAGRTLRRRRLPTRRCHRGRRPRRPRHPLTHLPPPARPHLLARRRRPRYRPARLHRRLRRRRRHRHRPSPIDHGRGRILGMVPYQGRVILTGARTRKASIQASWCR